MLSPTLTVSFTQFWTQKGAEQSSFHQIDDPRLLTFVSFGTLGRFDIGGTTVTPAKKLARVAR